MGVLCCFINTQSPFKEIAPSDITSAEENTSQMVFKFVLGMGEFARGESEELLSWDLNLFMHTSTCFA